MVISDDMMLGLYWDDLAEDTKEVLIKIFGDNNNWDVIPIAIINIPTDTVNLA